MYQNSNDEATQSDNNGIFDGVDLSGFLAELGLENAPNRDQIITDMDNLVQQKLTVKISERLSTEQLEELNGITDEKLSADWIAANLPELPTLVAEAVAEMKHEILSFLKSAPTPGINAPAVEKGEIITLNGVEYICLAVMVDEDEKRYLYLVTASEPLSFCFAEEKINGNVIQMRIVGGKEEKMKLWNLLKLQNENL